MDLICGDTDANAVISPGGRPNGHCHFKSRQARTVVQGELTVVDEAHRCPVLLGVTPTLILEGNPNDRSQ